VNSVAQVFNLRLRKTHNMHTITAAVLDVDGTVVTCPYDFDAMRAAVGEEAARFGVNTADLGVKAVLEQIAAVTDLLGSRGGEFRVRAESAVEEIEVAAAGTASIIPGARDALDALRSRSLAVALITRNCRAAARIVLEGLDCYDVLLTRDDVPRVKPDPDHVLQSLARVARPADRAAMIGDHAFDMQAGRAAGVRVCVGVRTGNSPDASLLSAGAEAVLDSLADLPRWLAAYEEGR
jgi:phosphoglycolate phosphatase